MFVQCSKPKRKGKLGVWVCRVSLLLSQYFYISFICSLAMYLRCCCIFVHSEFRKRRKKHTQRRGWKTNKQKLPSNLSSSSSHMEQRQAEVMENIRWPCVRTVSWAVDDFICTQIHVVIEWNCWRLNERTTLPFRSGFVMQMICDASNAS